MNRKKRVRAGNPKGGSGAGAKDGSEKGGVFRSILHIGGCEGGTVLSAPDPPPFLPNKVCPILLNQPDRAYL